MPTINTSSRARRILQVLALGASVTLLSACGSSDDTDASTFARKQQSSPHSIQHCLERRGAARARAVSDLAVLVKAEEEDDVSKPGFAYDKAASVIVDVWTGGDHENRPAPWMMWIGHPFGKHFTPEEIVVKQPPKSYVMYVTTAKERRRAENCLTFSGDRERAEPSAEINLTH